MRLHPLALTLASSALWIALIGASPQVPAASFQTAALERLSSGAVIVSQASGGNLVAIDIAVPAGLAQQTTNTAGVAGVTAALTLRTPMDGGESIADAAASVGATLTYTLDPLDTRFYLEAQPAQFAGLLHGLAKAIGAPDARDFAAVRTAALASAASGTASPAIAALDMLRQVAYAGTGYAYPDAGRRLSLAKLTPSDVSTFAALYRRRAGTMIALEGAVDDKILAAVRSEFGGRGASADQGRPLPKSQYLIDQGKPLSGRGSEVVTHRAVSAPWVAVGYPAPTMYSSDYPAMLVIEALLGRGGDVHTFSLGSNTALPGEFVGAYYQFEAQPGMLAIFLNGSDTSVDGAVRDLQSAVNRLRGALLPDTVLNRARRLAVGQYYTGVTNMGDAAWLLGRAAASPDGTNFENLVPVRIAQVSAADVRRAARRYLAGETLGIVLPQASTQR